MLVQPVSSWWRAIKKAAASAATSGAMVRVAYKIIIGCDWKGSPYRLWA
jgi:hypothetical protein